MSCPLHGFPLKDERGCWQCLDELRTAGKLEQKLNKPKKLYQIPKVSQKQARLNREIAASRKEVMQGGVCSGCGRREGGLIVLEDSHLISRDDCRKFGRLDLYTDPRNRRPHCRTWLDHEGCHKKWESPTLRHTLLDYQPNMRFIKSELPQVAKEMLLAAAKEL